MIPKSWDVYNHEEYAMCYLLVQDVGYSLGFHLRDKD